MIKKYLISGILLLGIQAFSFAQYIPQQNDTTIVNTLQTKLNSMIGTDTSKKTKIVLKLNMLKMNFRENPRMLWILEQIINNYATPETKVSTPPTLPTVQKIKGTSVTPSIKQQLVENKNQQIIYSNKTYAFSLIFPKTWKNYIVKNRILNWGSNGTGDSIDFGFPIQDDVFNISIHTKSAWPKIISGDGPSPSYLGENDQYVFSYGVGQDAANEEIITRMKEIQDIIKTFKITQ